MNILAEYLIVFLQVYIISIFLSGCGFIFKKKLFNESEKNYFENNIIWGIIFISFISLIINFLLPLNIIVNSIVFILICGYFFYENFFKQDINKFLKKSILTSSLAFILIIHSNVNNPDALLYHLPYTKILNDFKILIGSFNIHHRFAHISMIQYTSSFFNLLFIGKNGILIPLSILGSSFLIYFLKEFKILFKKKSSRINSLIIFFILIVSLYSFNRYSNYGNDAPVHLFFYLMFVYIFKYNLDFKNDVLLKKITLISLFCFFLKPFYIVAGLIPLTFLIFNQNYKNFFHSIFFIFLSIFTIAWFLKNFLISSCLIYPLKFTCFNNIIWSNPTEVENQNLLGEVMSKSWQDRSDMSISKIDYNKNFEWVSTWFDNHFIVIIEKFFPIILFLILFLIFIFFSKIYSRKKFFFTHNFIIYFLLGINLIGLMLWFIKFPIYRYGQSYLFCSILFTFYVCFFNKINIDLLFKYKKLFSLIIIIIFLCIITKSFYKISNKINDPIMPNMFDNIIHKNISVKFFNSENVFTHYVKKGGGLCGYSVSPCSENEDKNIRLKNKFGYKIYYLKKTNLN
jgi:hypothetical protein